MRPGDDHRAAVERTYQTASPPVNGPRLAGYTDAQLSTVPEGVSFFGCGNPLAYAAVVPGQTVLDLGSGAGLDLILASQAVGASGTVIGVDMTDAMLERARANIAHAGLANVDVRQGLIEALPVEDASVDWVISNCVISLSANKDRVFAEIARVLRPGGRMLISDIVVDAPMAWCLRRLARLAPSFAMAQTEAYYMDSMQRAGLAEVRVVDRLIYEPSDLVGLFGGGLSCEAGICAVGAMRSPLQSLARRSTSMVARAVAGHVWSSKMQAVRP